MSTRIDLRRLIPDRPALNLIILSALLVFASFLLEGNVGLHIADEGFLWYGTIRTALGDVPIRDFQAYDPGRYYWGALWFKIIGNNGIMALRVSEALFQLVGLSLFMLLLRRVLSSRLALLAAASILMIWMFPLWKIYEPVITIAAVYFAVLLIEHPTRKRHLVAGIFVGIAAFFGRNHGLYCFVAFLSLILFSWWKLDRKELAGKLGVWTVGISIGYAPMLLMFSFVPGFFSTFVEGIKFNIHQGTNLPLRVPWPWVGDYSRLSVRGSIQLFTVGLLYVVLPLFYFLATSLLIKSWRRLSPVLMCSTVVGITYLHYSFDRPHLFYLAWTIPPFLIGVIAIAGHLIKSNRKVPATIVWALLLIMSWAALDQAPEVYTLAKARALVKAKVFRRNNGDLKLAMRDYNLVPADISGDHLWIDDAVAQAVAGARAITQEFIPANELILIAPYWTVLYPLLGKEAPLHEIYFLFPQSKVKQERMISDLTRSQVNWAIICHHYLDGRPELAFEYTHGYVWQYLTANFETIRTGQTAGWLRDCELMHRSPRPPLTPSDSHKSFSWYPSGSESANQRAELVRAFLLVNAGDKDQLTRDRIVGNESTLEHQRSDLSATGTNRQLHFP
jgi:hypothetical protein